MPQQNLGRTWVEIDSAALIDNVSISRDASGGAAIMAVVKADAYGHGLANVSRELCSTVDAFGVATLSEALLIREAVDKDAMVMILGALLPDEREPAILSGLHVTVSSIDEARAYSDLSLAMKITVSIHLVADTGMGRMGFMENEFAAAAAQIAAMPGLGIEGFATHFPSADEKPEFTEHQISRFLEICTQTGIAAPWVHLANSAGILGFGKAGGNMVRPGLMLYGIAPVTGNAYAENLKPALKWKSRITQVRKLPAGCGISYGQAFVTTRATRIATLAVGYGDGYPRSLAEATAEVIIAGQRCPILGRVTMDMMMADVSNLEATPSPGDTATLIGGDNETPITAIELAQNSGMIPWEILTGISPRVKRVLMTGKS